MIQKINTLFHTLKHLRPTQIYHQVWYRIKAKVNISDEGILSYGKVLDKEFKHFVHNNTTYLGGNRFRFINLEQEFEAKVDWNFSEHKKLWIYNLNYFDFINQEDINSETSLGLIRQYIRDYDELKDGKEPYPTSLRIINWVKFMLSNNIKDVDIAEYIAKDTYRLQKNLEYHLLANHLLENAFALFFAGKYLQNDALILKAESLLSEQLDEQILNDGAHYELSPMYHQLMLYRVLDSIQLCDEKEEIKDFLVKKAQKMVDWLSEITFNNGDIPLVNDSAFGINPTTSQLLGYADRLGLKPKKISLTDSGYRMIRKNDYECFVDVGNVSPSYQPGHTHADSLSFVLYTEGKPCIVDTGTSTYNIGERRSYERSTSAHNTVVNDGKDSSQVWSGFRVGERAKTTVLEESESSILAVHDGYPKNHKRAWFFLENEIVISDKTKCANSKAYLHLHPKVEILVIGDDFVNTNVINLQFEGHSSIIVKDCKYAPQFNDYLDAKKIEIHFEHEMVTRIHT